MGGRTGILKVLSNNGSWRVVPVLALPAYPGGPSSFILPASPLPLLIRPFWRHYLCQLLLLPARTQSLVPDLPCLCQRSPFSALLVARFLAGLCSPFGFCLSGRGGRAPSGGGGGAPAPALCAVIGRDSVCRCRPMMERGGTGGPAPLGAGMRRRRSQRGSGSESRPSPPSNARLPAAAAASRGRWAAA